MKRIKILISSLFVLAIMSACSSDIELQDSPEVCTIEKRVMASSDYRIIEVSEETLLTAEQAYIKTPKQIVRFENGKTVQKTIDGLYIYQGDIILTDEQVECLKTTGSIFPKEGSVLPKAGIIPYPKQKWKHNTVHYLLQDDMTDRTKQCVREAIAHWKASTNLNFIEGMSAEGTVIFYNGDGCHSLVGKHGYTQKISIDAGWGTRGNAIHEIGHAIGLVHEHCLPNRNAYIIVNFNNIKDDWKSQYEIEKDVLCQDWPDITSVMMYDSYGSSSVAIDPTIPIMTTKDKMTWTAQRNGLSEQDVKIVNAWYNY